MEKEPAPPPGTYMPEGALLYTGTETYTDSDGMDMSNDVEFCLPVNPIGDGPAIDFAGVVGNAVGDVIDFTDGWFESQYCFFGMCWPSRTKQEGQADAVGAQLFFDGEVDFEEGPYSYSRIYNLTLTGEQESCE